MICRPIAIDGEVVGLACGPAPRKQKCSVCQKPDAPRLCDGPAPKRKSGTCDAPLCLDCTTADGEKDLCPLCSGGELRPKNKGDKCTRQSSCRSCGAAVYWVVWPDTGERMPIDAKPVPEGNIIVTHRVSVNELWAASVSNLSLEALEGRRRFVSHFKSCPAAKEWRKSK